MNNKLHFSSKSSEWRTPRDLFDRYDEIYHFDCDVASTAENALCPEYFTKTGHYRYFPESGRNPAQLIKLDNGCGLTGLWGTKRCWMNPPYGRDLKKWAAKAAEAAQGGATVVALLPARTDTAWFHQYVYRKKYVEVEFLKGRLKFSNHADSAPFPSMVVIFT